MKVLKNKTTGVFTMKRRKMIINDHSPEAEDKIQRRQFGQNLKSSKQRLESLVQVSDRQLKDTREKDQKFSRPSLNDKE